MAVHATMSICAGDQNLKRGGYLLMKTLVFATLLSLSTVVLSPSLIAQGVSVGKHCSASYDCFEKGDYLRPVQMDGDQPFSSPLWAEFDARPLSVAEKRFLQAALALRGHYNGLIDGAWGRGSQSALERFTRQTFDREPLNSDAAYLTLTALDTFLEDGWEPVDIGYLAISLMLPLKTMRLVEQSGLRQKWQHTEKDLNVVFNDFTFAELTGFHRGFEDFDDQTGTPYVLRQPDRWVTSINGEWGTGYVRSDLIGGTWSTVAIYGKTADVFEVGLISSSIKVGRASQILPETDGILIELADELSLVLTDDDVTDQGPSTTENFGVSQGPRRSQTEDEPQQSSGTGFFVNRDGAMLTNAHVIQGCSTVTVGGMSTDVISISQAFDLAVIKPAVDSDVSYLPFAAAEAGLNADITIAGYPLYGLLGGLNVSRGSISSMTGLGGDETSVQISAPVQPGNSGGPVIDRGGNVVGVVVSKLDVMEVANLTGDIAQNVNFAIRGSMAKIFLQANSIPFETRDTSEDVRPEQAAQVLQAATRLIQCVID